MPRKKTETTPVEPAPAEPPPVQPGGPPLSGRTFVFGTFLSDLSVEDTRNAIASAGGSVEETLSAATSFLVLDRINPNKKTKLEKQADKFNASGASIQVLDRTAFFSLLGITPPAPPEPAETPEPISTRGMSPDAVRKALLALLQGGPTGVQRWNNLSAEQRREADQFRKVDLSKAKLREADLHGLDFSTANLDDASLIEARLDYSDFRHASFLKANLRAADLRCSKFDNARFIGAILRDASLRASSFRSATFKSADLGGADLSHADLCGADFTGALFENTVFEKTKYDGDTIWPRFFKPGPEMERVSTPGEDRTSNRADASRPAGEIDIATFFARIESRVGKSEGGKRVMQKVKDMLKAEKFRLFAEVEEDHVAGVVKSQFDADPQAVYSCRLTATGLYDCYSPKLPVCGGMKYGGPCKHLLVLLVGLVRSGQLDATTADWWISQTKKTHRRTDEEALFETLIKYKGAEAGDVDWRPTETIPEDYYAL
jgi:hypothetical protein